MVLVLLNYLEVCVFFEIIKKFKNGEKIHSSGIAVLLEQIRIKDGGKRKY